MGTIRRISILAAASAALSLLGAAGAPPAATPAAAAAPHAWTAASKPRKGGYYTGTTAQGRDVTLDVSPSGKRVSAVSWAFDCAGQRAQAAQQNLKIKLSKGAYRFKGSGEEALLFLDTFLSEPGQVSTSGKFTSKGKKVVGAFRVVSPSCGDTGSIAYSAKVN